MVRDRNRRRSPGAVEAFTAHCGLASIPVTRLLLLRHGQSEWNASGRWQGQADPPLSELGLAQAKMAAAQVPRFDLLAASTLVRAHRTAETLGADFDHAGVHIDSRLMERSAGGFSGLTRAEIEVQYPGYLDAGLWPKGWESDEDLLVRVRDALLYIGELVGPGGTAVVVSHAGCIYALEGTLGEPFQRIPNLAGRWFDLSAGEFKLGTRIHLLEASDETVPDQI
jgi:broad specificity phosphatase PhoE